MSRNGCCGQDCLSGEVSPLSESCNRDRPLVHTGAITPRNGVAMSPAIQLPQVVNRVFNDIDEMATAALEWDQEYEQIGCGRFHGELTQLVLHQIQLNRERWTPGVLHSGAAPKNSWVFALPLKAKGSLHVRRRPVLRGELLAGTSRDDIGFAATGPTDLMIVVLPNSIIRRWMQARRGANGMDPDLPPRHWAVSAATMMRRSHALSGLLDELLDQSEVKVTPGLLTRVESRISDTILDMIPSAEIVESLHSRARIARSVLQLLHDRYDDPPSVTEMCEQVGARERTLFLSCVEAFGRPPAQLLLELRLNAVHRMLVHPVKGASITGVASHYGFTHFGRFASMYFRRFGELPSATLAKALGSN
jgi:AraC family transcriptional regulator, ethanolamine operon transcriptional activator